MTNQERHGSNPFDRRRKKDIKYFGATLIAAAAAAAAYESLNRGYISFESWIIITIILAVIYIAYIIVTIFQGRP